MVLEEPNALLDLQALDTSIDQHKHRRATLPERAALVEIARRVEQTRSALRDAAAARDEVASRQDALESELTAAERRSAEVSRRLYGGEVSASRELQAMSEELDSLKARVSGIEDRLLAVLEEREPLDDQVTVHESELARLRAEGDGIGRALAAAEEQVDSEIAELDRRREETAARVPESLSAQYERLRSRLGGVAVARLVGNRCDGCHLTLPATELDRIRHLPAGEMVTCDQCGRILVVG
ncbi:MAG TPA: C4-type zinc ribbon domain-containing protein [Acidimicrobiales bacterium]|nr:C4-type zinc ribbon domain-containing protein [Acidimicrobiales bacterium]